MRIIRPTLQDIVAVRSPFPGVQRLPHRPVIDYVRDRPGPRFDMPLVRSGFQGRYKVMVIDARTKRVVHERPWACNLILDQGLNQYNTTQMANVFLRCAVGTGTTPTFRDSTGTATLTVSGTDCTASDAFFEAADEGRLLKLDSGGEAYIATYTSPTAVVLGTAPGDSGPEDGCVWYVNQTGLTSESKRTNTYLTGAGNCGTTFSGGILTLRRTFDFTAEAAPVNYAELGWANSATPGANLFSRTLIAGGTVSVGVDQLLRVIYDLAVTFSPNTLTGGATTITGWPVAPASTQDGDYIFTNVNTSNTFGRVGTSGATVTSGNEIEPAVTTTILGYGSASTAPSYGSAYSPTSIASANSTKGSFTPGTWSITRSVTFAQGTGNSTGIRNMYLNDGAAFVFVWDEAQTKANTHTLTLTQPQSWGRVLTNP